MLILEHSNKKEKYINKDMENIFDRLQFVKGLNPQRENGVFDTREDAVNYVLEKQFYERPAVLAEPIVLTYESGSAAKGPNVILAIGSKGKGTPASTNRTFFIDTQKTEEEIEALDEKIEEALKGLILIPLESDTIKLNAEKNDIGTVISGDVKIADYRIVDGNVNYNIIQTEGDKGIYAFVDMNYDEETSIITFNVNGATKEIQLPEDQHVVKGWYDEREESIFLKLADGSQVKVVVSKLIEEWTVLPDGQTINGYDVSGQTVYFTPVVFSKTHVGSEATEHEGIYDWQDVLEADVRVADHISNNILHKDRTGRYLYVKGTADNIGYKDGLTVKDALDNVDMKVSTSAGNLIYKRPDGIFATAMLGYKAAENKLTYTYSDAEHGEIKEIEFQLNSVKILEDITYDPVREVIVIRYIDAQGEYQKVEIPVADIIEEWDVNNEAHNIKLNKYRSEGAGKDILTADAKIHVGNNNILEDLNHELYVNGIADNIKYDSNGMTTVKDVLDDISGVTEDLSNKLDIEIENRINADNAINEVIGDGFDPRNTVRDEIDNLQNEIDSLSSETSSKLADIVNEDHSIDINKENPTVPVVKVNLSTEIEDNKPNVIKLNNDGLYAGVDLEYVFNEEVGTNQLIFKTTNATKVFDLQTNSVIDKIYYDPVREAIVIEYTVNGHRMPDVVIPVGDLINEWRIWDGHEGAVQLEKIRIPSGTSEQDILKAEVVINDTHDDNILVNDGGSLYVSGAQIAQNADDISALNDALDNIESGLTSLENAINAEVSRAMSAEESLDAKIDAEIARATNREEYILGSLNEEIARSTSVDETLTNDLAEEILRSTNKDQQLTDSINNEVVRAMSAETALDTKIDAEASRATAAETALQTAINHEATTRESEDSRIEAKLDSEISRSTAKDNELQSQINDVESDLANEILRATNAESALSTSILSETDRARLAETELNNALSGETQRATAQENYLLHLISDETANRENADSALTASINAEISRATSAETALDARIDNEAGRIDDLEDDLRATNENLTAEVTRSTYEDERLASAISAETQAREDADAALEAAIRTATKTFESTSCISAETDANNVVKHYVTLAGGENIIKCDGGLYASVSLSYDAARNTIQLVTSDGEQAAIQLNTVGSLIDGMYYDATNRALVIEYHDAAGNPLSTSFPVNELFNDWVVQNPSEKSAIELTKVVNTGDTADVLGGRVLITDDHDGDGKPDQGSDNIIEIRNNGLYVCGSGITKTEEDVECVQNELKVLEKAIFDNPISEPCGSGYTFTPNQHTNYIFSATSVVDETYILDQSVKGLSSYTESVDNKVDIVSADTECANSKANKLFKLLYGENASMENCGSGSTYNPYLESCVISGATSFEDADKRLSDELCALMGLIGEPGKTPSTDAGWEGEAGDKKLVVNVRLSHGSQNTMSDDDLIISGMSSSEFTNTNAVRIVNIEDTEVDSPFNGVYVSNVWNCGMYYGPSDTEAKEQAEAEGYNTNYNTDESPSAQNINYMNNVRQTDV